MRGEQKQIKRDATIRGHERLRVKPGTTANAEAQRQRLRDERASALVWLRSGLTGWVGTLRQGKSCASAMSKDRARTTGIWSAVTCHRFHRFGDLPPKQRRVQRLGTTTGRPLAFNGDKSPPRKRRELAALQSRWWRRQPRQVHLRRIHDRRWSLGTGPAADRNSGQFEDWLLSNCCWAFSLAARSFA
jgi:hypothetical protein